MEEPLGEVVAMGGEVETREGWWDGWREGGGREDTREQNNSFNNVLF